MNAGTGLVAIVSLLLALAGAGGAATEQAGVDTQAAKPVTTSKIALNHNETLVSDSSPVEQADGSLYAPKKAGCPVWMCGTNHNETMVSDAAR